MSAAKQLESFFARIDVDRQQLVDAESIRELHLVLDRRAGEFAALQTEDYEKLLDKLGGALSLQIGLPNLPPLLSIVAGQESLPLAEGSRAVARMDGRLDLRLNLSVAKGPLLAHWRVNGGDLYIRPFLFSESFVRLLQADLLTLDKHLFAAPDRATLVVLEDADLYLSGDMLHIAGVPAAKQILASAGSLDYDFKRRLNDYRANARATLSWGGFGLNNITPLHFVVSDQQSAVSGQQIRRSAAAKSDIRHPTSDIQNLLATHALTTNVLYTANRSAYEGSDFTAVYAAVDNTGLVRLPPTSEFAPDAEPLANWATWPFSGDEGDRLTFLQNVTARELRSDDADENYAVLNRRLGHILNEARWHNRVFVDAQIDEHFEELQDLADMAGRATGAVGETIDTLSKGFVDALLGAVGVIVLTLLAALVEANRPEIIFRLGMFGYAFYLVFFQGVYRMGSLLHSYRLLEAETEARLAAFERRLGAARVEEAKQQLEARRGQFRTWFWLTAVLYLLVALFLIVLAYWLPGWLAAP